MAGENTAPSLPRSDDKAPKHIRRDCPEEQRPCKKVTEGVNGRQTACTANHQIFFAPKGCACKK